MKTNNICAESIALILRLTAFDVQEMLEDMLPDNLAAGSYTLGQLAAMVAKKQAENLSQDTN